MLLDHEVAEERSVEHLDRKVLAPGGRFVRVTHVCKTVPMEVWRLETRHHALECAGRHLVMTHRGFLPVDQIEDEVTWIFTESGWEYLQERKPLGEKRELYDLRVESEDHLYFTGGIASHNSTGLGAGELFKCGVLPNYHSIYLTPLKEQSKTIADKLLDMQRGSVMPPEYITRKGYRNNMYYKEFPHGGSLKLMHILTDPSKIRGNTAPAVVIDEAQDFDATHLPEIEQVQKNYRRTRMTIFAGTSKDLDTCLEAQYRIGSRGVWHIPCTCKDHWHSLGDEDRIEGMLSVDGLRCPNDRSKLLNPATGEWVHEDRSRLNVHMPSFHLPQVIVPEYAHGKAFLDIWKHYKRYPWKKFLMEVWGIAVESGLTEITETDLKRCCTEYTFAQTQERYLSGKVRYAWVFSGVDWGGSDYEPAYRSKLSYTVHTVYGMRLDGSLDLIHAHRYAGMDYREIGNLIVRDHLKYKALAMGTDNGGGLYYNHHMRDSGRIPMNLLVQFQYTDTRLMLDRLDGPDGANVMSLHRTDSISALINDIKDQKITWPRWDEANGFALDCLNVRRNITEAPSGKTIMRYIKHGAKADDFLMATNYASMMKRIVNKESMIPNQQLMEEINRMFGLTVTTSSEAGIMQAMEGGYVSG